MIYPNSFYAVPIGGTVTTIRLVGRNADIDTGTVPESVWSGSGAYAFLAAAEGLTVVSADANDTNDPLGEPPGTAAGTGARTVTITGLSSAYAVTAETVELNGTAAVETVADFLRVNGVSVASAGSGGANAGAVTLAGAETTTATLSVIAAGANTAHSCVYTVPTGKRLYIVGIHAICTNASASTITADLKVREYGGVWKVVYPMAFAAGAPFTSAFHTPIEVGGRADIDLVVTAASASNNVITATLDAVLVG